jgi:hypothetical protein
MLHHHATEGLSWMDAKEASCSSELAKAISIILGIFKLFESKKLLTVVVELIA